MGAKLSEGDKSMIRNGVGNWHVSLPDGEAAQKLRELCAKATKTSLKAGRLAPAMGGTWAGWCSLAVKYGVRVHQENRAQYIQVMQQRKTPKRVALP